MAWNHQQVDFHSKASDLIIKFFRCQMHPYGYFSKIQSKCRKSYNIRKSSSCCCCYCFDNIVTSSALNIYNNVFTWSKFELMVWTIQLLLCSHSGDQTRYHGFVETSAWTYSRTGGFIASRLNSVSLLPELRKVTEERYNYAQLVWFYWVHRLHTDSPKPIFRAGLRSGLNVPYMWLEVAILCFRTVVCYSV